MNNLPLAQQIRNRKLAIEADKMAVLKAKWGAAVAIATGPEMRQKILNSVEKYHGNSFDNFTFIAMDSRGLPNRKGGTHYDIPLNGGGNMYCAIRDGKVTQEALFGWYPPFATVRDFYLKEGFKVEIIESSNGDGMDSWLELVISL